MAVMVLIKDGTIADKSPWRNSSHSIVPESWFPLIVYFYCCFILSLLLAWTLDVPPFLLKSDDNIVESRKGVRTTRTCVLCVELVFKGTKRTWEWHGGGRLVRFWYIIAARFFANNGTGERTTCTVMESAKKFVLFVAFSSSFDRIIIIRKILGNTTSHHQYSQFREWKFRCYKVLELMTTTATMKIPNKMCSGIIAARDLSTWRPPSYGH